MSESTRARNTAFKARNAAVRALLVETWPKAFMPKGAEKLPLKIGIAKDIAGALPEVTLKALTHALRDYATGTKYLRNVVEGAPRIDLDGAPAGTVTAEAETYSRVQIQMREAAIKIMHAGPNRAERRAAKATGARAGGAACDAVKRDPVAAEAAAAEGTTSLA